MQELQFYQKWTFHHLKNIIKLRYHDISTPDWLKREFYSYSVTHHIVLFSLVPNRSSGSEEIWLARSKCDKALPISFPVPNVVNALFPTWVCEINALHLWNITSSVSGYLHIIWQDICLPVCWQAAHAQSEPDRKPFLQAVWPFTSSHATRSWAWFILVYLLSGSSCCRTAVLLHFLIGTQN